MAESRNIYRERALHQVHVPKTGGTAVRHILKEREISATADGTPIRAPMGHIVALDLIFGAHIDNQAFFFVREPLTRYVSGFNSRLREGAPTYNVPWRPNERQVFEVFTTANDLAEGLTAADAERRRLARFGMSAISQLPRTYSQFFKGLGYLQEHVDRLFFVGFTETFDADMATFIERVGYEPPTTVPRHHGAPPDSATQMSETAADNVRRWYADDIAIYDWLRTERDRWGSGADLGA